MRISRDGGICLSPRALWVLLLLVPCLPWAVARAEESDAPHAAYLEQVRSAAEAGDDVRIRELAGRSSLSPWVAADLLWADGQAAAALRFARALSGKAAFARLPALVASLGDSSPDPEVRALRTEVEQRWARGDMRGAWLALEDAPPADTPVVGVVLAEYRGSVLRKLGRAPEAERAYVAGARLAHEIGWHAQQSRLLSNAYEMAASRNDATAAFRHASAALEAARADGRAHTIRSALRTVAWAHMHHRRYEDAVAHTEEALRLAREEGSPIDVAGTLVNMGIIYQQWKKPEEAYEWFGRGLAASREVGHDFFASNALTNQGVVLVDMGRYGEAHEVLEESLALKRRLGHDSLGVVKTLIQLARIETELRDYERARTRLKEARTRTIKLGHAALTWTAVRALAGIDILDSRLQDARAAYEAALEQARGLDSTYNEQAALQGLFHVSMLASDREAGLAYAKAARAVAGKRNAADIASCDQDLGEAYQGVGDLGKARFHLERAAAFYRERKEAAGEAKALSALSRLEASLGQSERAQALRERAERLAASTGDPFLRAVYDLRRASQLAVSGDNADARRILERIRPVFARARDPHREAETAGELAKVCLALEDYEAARRHADQAIAFAEQNGGGQGGANWRTTRADLRERTGDLDGALEDLAVARTLAEASGSPAIVFRTAFWEAAINERHGRHVEAFDALMRSLRAFQLTGGDLAEQERMGGADVMVATLEGIALNHAAALNDASRVFEVITQARGQLLRDGLANREALLQVIVPSDMRREASRAREVEAQAASLLRQTQREGRRKPVRAADEALERARADRLQAVGRIQQYVRRSADLVAPSPTSLKQVQAGLGSHERVVIYSVKWNPGRVLVIGPESVDLHELAKPEGLPQGTDAVPSAPDAPVSPDAASRLASYFVEPLGLPAEVSRILFVPHGALFQLPPIQLFGDREVVVVPAPGLLGAPVERQGLRGRRVFGLGDPDYAAEPAVLGDIRGKRSGMLTPLPQTRKEIEAVADVRVLGDDATEASFRKAMATEEQWRSVHLACHGLLESRAPLLSCLAVTPDSANDGFLTALEIFGMEVKSDLVVLSACETGSGGLNSAEGIIGLTRSFLHAGAPRVIASLWKVDDEATQVLMKRFYEIWNAESAEGVKAPTVAGALRQAQSWVAGQEKWSHPYYWAGWVVWSAGG